MRGSLVLCNSTWNSVPSRASPNRSTRGLRTSGNSALWNFATSKDKIRERNPADPRVRRFFSATSYFCIAWKWSGGAGGNVSGNAGRGQTAGEIELARCFACLHCYLVLGEELFEA